MFLKLSRYTQNFFLFKEKLISIYVGRYIVYVVRLPKLRNGKQNTLNESQFPTIGNLKNMTFTKVATIK